MKKKNNNKIWSILLIEVISICIIAFFVNKYYKPCIKEHGAVGFGVVMIPTGQCCQGLILKNEVIDGNSIIGGAICMKSECDIECKYIGSESEGLYSICNNTLIKYINCG